MKELKELKEDMITEPTVIPFPKTFKEISQDYLQELQHYLNNAEEDSEVLYQLDDLYGELGKIIDQL